MSYGIRQRLKRILIAIAEDPKESKEKRLQAAQQIVDILKVDDVRHTLKDKAKLQDIRTRRMVMMQARLDKAKAERDRLKPQAPKPKPLPEGPNSLGIDTK